jgi:hypothetical protein
VTSLLRSFRYQQSELVHCRWAMLGVAGVLVQEVVKPDVYFYEAGLPQNLPGPFKDINMGGLLAWEFILMHFVEVIRWQDYKNFGSVNEVPPQLGLADTCSALVNHTTSTMPVEQSRVAGCGRTQHLTQGARGRSK